MKLRMNIGQVLKSGRTVLAVILVLSASVSSLPAFAQMIGTIGVGDITYSAADKSRSQENIVSALNSGLNKSFLDTRKFTVLDYAQLEKRLGFQGLTLEGFYTKSYNSTEYLQAGLDYILTADISEFGVFEQKRGRYTSQTGLVDLDFKLLGVADATRDFESSVSAQASVRVSSGEGVDLQELMDKAMEQAVDQLVDQVISTLHPIRVMKISEDRTITLNYGEGVLAAGDTVLVYPKGQDIQLDAGGEPIGESIATLQIITTKKKFSTAQALDGFDALEKGQKGQLLLVGG